MFFFDNDNDDEEHQVWHPTLGYILWTKRAFISIYYNHYSELWVKIPSGFCRIFSYTFPFSTEYKTKDSAVGDHIQKER